MAESPKQIKVFLCFEPDLQVCAERVTQWPVTNADFTAYNGRVAAACDSSAAETARQAAGRQIQDADVLICFIGSMQQDPWILWELETAKAAGKGLVGILLKDYVDPPAVMRFCGAIFISFKKDLVERAVAFAVGEERDLAEDYTLEDE